MMSKKHAIELYNYLAEQRYQKTEQEIIDYFNYSKSSFDRAKRTLRDELGITLLSPANGGYKLLEHEKNRIHIGDMLVTQKELIDLLQVIKLLQPVAQKNHLNAVISPALKRMQMILPAEYSDKLDFVDAFSHGEREQSNPFFQKVLHAFQQNKRLEINYMARSDASGQTRLRQISPQKILRYRSNWYLIAWCHLREDLRTFSIEKINSAKLLDLPNKKINKTKIEQHYTLTYGIFSGEKVENAELEFYPPLSLWVQDECWHHQQQGHLEANHCYHLSIPIGENLTEIVMQLAMYGDAVRVISPPRLKQALIEHYESAIQFLKEH